MCLNTYYVPGPVLGPGSIAVNKTDKMWLLRRGSGASGEREMINKMDKSIAYRDTMWVLQGEIK